MNKQSTFIVLKSILFFLCVISTATCSLYAQEALKEREYRHVFQSVDGHGGQSVWKMKKADEITAKTEDISTLNVSTDNWMPAIVPGTVLNSLVYNKVYPEPYFGMNNKAIPDVYHAGRDFYTYWFRTEFDLQEEQYKGKKTWLQVDGINYRAEIWLNGNMVGNIAGMFYQDQVDISDYIKFDRKNVLAVKTYPVDFPGTVRVIGRKSFGAGDEFHNGGDGEIGKNVTMLMTVGWDFIFMDGIRDRNTGIWKDISIFTTGNVKLRHPFVKSDLRKPDYQYAKQTVSVEVSNATFSYQKVKVVGEIQEGNIRFEKEVGMFRSEVKEVVFTPEEFPQLAIDHPRLWWPVNKGKPDLYHITFKTFIGDVQTDELTSQFGIREIISDRNTPDTSRQFYVNGQPIFIRGTNWIPEGMLRLSNERTNAELRYTAQSGVNMIRFWGGGITESDYFFQLCDELGIMIWTEFWLTGDTKHAYDVGLYLKNAASTIKRIRNHPSLAYYVCSNESTEMPHIKDLIHALDGTRGYQMQSETDGVHDGSPYRTLNVMRYYENTASERGSRIDGFNPEYGAPCLPTVECLREMIPEKDLWPINATTWEHTNGTGYYQMTSTYIDQSNEYGKSNSIDELAQRGQFVGALNYKSIWEVWNYNKLNYGDRYCSGFLFWYHNSPIRQVNGRMWDWSLEPTAALYATQNACEPLHPQFDYLKNTVSVVNDYFKVFNNYKVKAEVFDLNMKKVFAKEAVINLPSDGVVNDVFKIDFPENITNVHFIRLNLYDEKGRQAGSNFYWRSNNKYEGQQTMTGPATAGFQDINKLGRAQIKAQYKTRKENGKHFIDLELSNTGKTLSFFTQIQWLDKSGKPVRPSFYTDNFLNLMPGDKRKITIETNMNKLPDKEYILVVKGFNATEQRFAVKTD